MGYKEDFWQAIDEELPESIADLLGVTINVSSVIAPADPDAAIVETGKLAAKLNAILDSLDGLSPVELALRIGQKNVTSKLMLLASIEADTADSAGEEAANAAGFEVLVPVEGKEYDAWTFPFQVQRLDPTIDAIACLVDDAIEVELTRDGNLFTGSPQSLMHSGEHTAVFTGSNEKSLAVTFSIAELKILTYPSEGEILHEPIFTGTVAIEGSSSGVFESIKATIKDAQGRTVISPLNLIRTGQEILWTVLFDLVPPLKEMSLEPLIKVDIPLETWYEYTLKTEDAILAAEEKVVRWVLNITEDMYHSVFGD